MKILELTRSFYPSLGGMEKFVDDRLKIYESLGIDFKIITTDHSEKRIAGSKKLSNVSYLPSYTPYTFIPRLKKSLDLEYDILSVNQLGYYYSDYAIKRASKEGKKIVVTPHLYFHTNRYKQIKMLHKKLILPNIINKVDKVICFTQFEANFWKEIVPKISHKIEILPHYIKSIREIEMKILPTKNKYILFVGRGEKNKRIDLLLSAFIKINSGLDLFLTLEEEEISPSLLKGISDNDRIHLLGRVTEGIKLNLFANCSALILPTDYEAFGIVNFEASNFSKPLILSDLQVFREIHNTKGVIYFDNNVESLASAIGQFSRLSQSEKDRMGRINKNNLEKFSFEIVSSKYQNLFNSLF